MPKTTPSVTVEALRELDAFKLFRERATHAKSDWELTQDNARTVAEILELTEGIPLAIELATARLSSLELVEIREDLDKGGRLDFLRRHPSGGDPRHDSMKACLDWSFGLLKPDERDLFAALSVFHGGFFIDDARQVCEAENAPKLIESLREASLVKSAELVGSIRCTMLQVVREYAAEKLGPRTEQLKRRHATHFLKVLTEADEQLKRNEQAKGFARIDADYENILAGVETSRELHEHRALIEYSGRLANYLSYRGRFAQGLALAKQALEAAEVLKVPVLVAGMQNNLGNAYGKLPTGDRGENLKRAIACFEAALWVRTERDFPTDWAMTQNNLGNAYGDLPTDREDNLKRAIDCYQAALRVRTEGDSPREWAATQNNLGATYGDLMMGDRGENLKRAIACFEAALRVRTECDFPFDWASTQNNLGSAYAQLPPGSGENLKRAIDCYKAALRVYTEGDFPREWAMTQNNLGSAYGNLATGDPGENLRRAVECFEAALRVYTEQDFPRDWAMTQSNLGITYGKLPAGDPVENVKLAIDCFEAAARGFTAAGMTDHAGRAAELAAALKELRG